GSRDYIDLTQVSTSVARSEICTSLAGIQEHGLVDGWGEFAFPDNRTSLSLERMALECGYAFGRRYSGGINPVPIPSPYWLGTATIDGGACVDQSLPCYAGQTRFHYADPATLKSLLTATP